MRASVEYIAHLSHRIADKDRLGRLAGGSKRTDGSDRLLTPGATFAVPFVFAGRQPAVVPYLLPSLTNRIARASPSAPTNTSALILSSARSIFIGKPNLVRAERGNSTRTSWPPS